VMRDGRRLDAGRVTLDTSRAHAAASLHALPQVLRGTAPAEPPYAVAVSERLHALQQQVTLDAGGAS
jgi:nicotinate phosphoribosyltransferase